MRGVEKGMLEHENGWYMPRKEVVYSNRMAETKMKNVTPNGTCCHCPRAAQVVKA